MIKLGVCSALSISLQLSFAAFAASIPVQSNPQDVGTTAVMRSTPSDPDTSPTFTSPDITVAHADSVTTKAPVVAFDPTKMMPVDEIRPGMKGYGLSVFSGLEPEKFDVDVIGVRHRMMAGTDIILCRIKSPHLVNLGVIAGMSGSPVYINDRLIGAVAYGFTNVDDPLAGVTPIDTMLSVYNSTPVTGAQDPDAGTASAINGGFSQYESYRALKANPSIEAMRKVALPAQSWQNLTMHSSDFGTDASSKFGLPDQFTLHPLSAPVNLSSDNPLTAQLAETLFGNLNIMSGAQAMAAGNWAPSATAPNSPGGPVENLQAFSNKITGGYALAIPFIEGDLNMAAVGTVTWRHDNRLVAFGHPMFQSGSVYCPMAAARINTIIRSREKPFKLGEPIGQIGMIRQDRLPAVGGLFGTTARMFPVTTKISDPNYAGERTYNFRIWDDKRMAPGLIMSALIESLGAAARQGGDSAALYSYSLKLNDGTTVTAENYSSDSGGTIMAALGAMADAGVLLNNPFKPVSIDEMSFSMELRDKLRQASIEAASLDLETYKPGQMAQLECLLRPYRSEPVKVNFSFQIPAEMSDGEYSIVVSDADTRERLESKRNPGIEKIRTYDDLLRELQKNFAQNRVYLSLVDSDTGISVRGTELPKLPGSIINLMQDTVDPEYLAPVRGNFVIDADMKTNYEIHGQTTLKLNVARSIAD